MTSTAPTAQRSERQVIAYLAFLSMVMAFGVDTALPAFDEIRSEFGIAVGDSSVSLVVTTYLLGMGIGYLVYGVLSDRFGRAPVLRAGLLVYGLGALGATLAASLGALLAFRFIWGLGAAAPGGLRPAIARDLYSGERMARVVSIVMAVFLLGPIVGPIVGELLVGLAGWRATMAVPGLLAVIAVVWSFRFGETLPTDCTQPLRLRQVLVDVAEITRSRVTIGYTLVLTVVFGAFFSFLGSSQPIIDNVYHRPEQFALFFGINGAVMGAVLWISSRVVARIGTTRLMSTGVGILLVVATVQLGVTTAADGRPDIWVWIATISMMNAGTMVISATATSLALEPMQHIAGTASAVVSAISMLGAAMLGSVIDSRIDDTVTPLTISYLVCGLGGCVIMVWARGGQGRDIAELQ